MRKLALSLLLALSGCSEQASEATPESWIWYTYYSFREHDEGYTISIDRTENLVEAYYSDYSAIMTTYATEDGAFYFQLGFRYGSLYIPPDFRDYGSVRYGDQGPTWSHENCTYEMRSSRYIMRTTIEHVIDVQCTDSDLTRYIYSLENGIESFFQGEYRDGEFIATDGYYLNGRRDGFGNSRDTEFMQEIAGGCILNVTYVDCEPPTR